MPFGALYAVSDFIYIIMYKLVAYRREVVSQNLKLAFPDKSDEERKLIEKKFYKHFADLFVEMIKAFNMSNKQIQKHFVFNNVEVLNDILAKNQNVIVVGGHYANWEWVFSLAMLTDAPPVATYLKINNPYFEKMMLKNRGRFGGKLIETKKLRKTLEKFKQNNEQYVLGLLADQSPQLHRTKYWRTFLGHGVPVFVGPEELAKKYNNAYVFIDISKVKRGYYEVDFELITSNPNDFDDYQLTDILIDKIEKQIRKQPEYYLWTHRRFKHKDKKAKIAHRLLKQ
jgi:KDO2-lipid IV(A) lauroyltransferase